MLNTNAKSSLPVVASFPDEAEESFEFQDDLDSRITSIMAENSVKRVLKNFEKLVINTNNHHLDLLEQHKITPLNPNCFKRVRFQEESLPSLPFSKSMPYSNEPYSVSQETYQQYIRDPKLWVETTHSRLSQNTEPSTSNQIFSISNNPSKKSNLIKAKLKNSDTNIPEKETFLDDTTNLTTKINILNHQKDMSDKEKISNKQNYRKLVKSLSGYKKKNTDLTDCVVRLEWEDCQNKKKIAELEEELKLLKIKKEKVTEIIVIA